MQIGDLSRLSGVHIETIRYYERIGILPRPDRLRNGRRTYSEGDERRLRFIRHARDLGFDLNSVRSLLDLQEQPEASCEAASALARAQLAGVESRMAQLGALQEELRRMILACKDGRVADCRIIEALAADNATQDSPSGPE